tara:strand:- start:97 stop:693 length:597 start_codon:yes stop_codon:yes gene_type:complete
MVTIYDTIREINQGLNDYCLSDCTTNCCHLGELGLSLPVSEQQVDLIIRTTLGNNAMLDQAIIKNELILQGSLLLVGPKARSYFGWDYSLNSMTCPALDGDNRCRIYDHPQKPDGCDDFPIGFTGETITLNMTCPYIRTNRKAIVKRIKRDHREELRTLKHPFTVLKVEDSDPLTDVIQIEEIAAALSGALDGVFVSF